MTHLLYTYFVTALTLIVPFFIIVAFKPPVKFQRVTSRPTLYVLDERERERDRKEKNQSETGERVVETEEGVRTTVVETPYPP